MWILAMALWVGAQDGRVEIESHRQQVQPSRADATLRIYDVRDLLNASAIDFEPPELGPARAGEVERAAEAPWKPSKEAAKRSVEQLPTLGFLFEKEEGEAELRAAAKRLEHVVRTYMTPAISDATEAIGITSRGSMSAVLRAEQHEWLVSFLTTQRTFQGFISVEAKLFSVPRGRLKALGIESSSAALAANEREAFLVRLQEDPKTQLVNAPALSTHPNQRANVSVINQVAYVKDYTIEIVEPNRQEIADPQIAVINEGIVLDVRATPMAGEELGLDLQLSNSKLVRPIRTKKVRLSTANAAEVEIGLPEVNTVRIKTTVRLAAGASIVLSTPGHDDTDLVMVVTAKRVEAAEIGNDAQKLDRR